MLIIFTMVLAVPVISTNVNVGTGENHVAYAAAKTHLNSTSKNLTEGKTFQLKLISSTGKTITASKVKWSSGNKKIAKISSKGKVTAVSPGKVNIKAKYKNKTYTLKLTVKAKSYQSIKFEDALKNATEYHTYLQNLELDKDKIDACINDNTASDCEITLEEINILRQDSKRKSSVSHDEAVQDIDLYFKALKYGYGGYKYFGGDEVFNGVKEKILKRIKNKDTVGTSDLAQIMHEELRFVRDGHFNINRSPIEDKDVRYEYYYDYDQVFYKDDEGYYQKINGEKWYYAGSADENVRIELTLLPTGDIVYSPILFLPATEKKKSSTLTLKHGKSEKKVELNFKENQSYMSNSSRVLDYNYLDENGITYISVRCFDAELKGELQDFVNTGYSAKDSRLIIFDLRSNGGGSDEFSRQWVRNFSGKEPKLNSVFVTKADALSKINRSQYGSETTWSSKNKGEMIENETPIIILMDDMCGSSGESALNFLRSMKNTIVIGSNSSGYQLCGNVSSFSLPNTGIGVGIPISLQFYYTLDEVDGKGYEPDVWCNPKDCYGYVLKMLEKQGYITGDEKEKLAAAFGERGQMTIDFAQFVVPERQGFGRIVDNKLIVKLDGKVIKNYTAVSKDPGVFTASVLSDGRLHLVGVKNDAEAELVITYKGREYVFYVVN